MKNTSDNLCGNLRNKKKIFLFVKIFIQFNSQSDRSSKHRKYRAYKRHSMLYQLNSVDHQRDLFPHRHAVLSLDSNLSLTIKRAYMKLFGKFIDDYFFYIFLLSSHIFIHSLCVLNSISRIIEQLLNNITCR